jgi:hypothetical protein
LGESGCDSARESLGLGRTPPDEFAVIDQPPLSIPPDFGLRPPMPGTPRPQSVDSSDRARELLYGSDAQQSADLSAASEGEKALLAQTGGDKAPADIRNTINRESAERTGASPHLVERLLGWKKDERSGAVVDADGEAARLKAAKEKGALETAEFQLGIFDGMPQDAQIAFLMEAAGSMDETKPMLDRMVAEWAEGDPEALAAVMNEGMEDPAVADALLYSRNRNWAEWIDTRLDKPGTVFIAVGAGHLAGAKSVQDYLAQKGIKVSRVK